MSNRTLNLNDQLYQYILDISLRESALLKRLRDETMQLEMARMQIAPEQGQFMQLLIKMLGAKRCLEIGVFTGYSALCVAQALPADGKLIACDINPEWTAVAQRYWREAGVDNKIELRLAPAMQTLNALLAAGLQEKFDFVFIDADKTAYDDYYETSLRLLRSGGLIVIDNVLWNGAVADQQKQDEDTNALRELNRKIHQDQRVTLSLLPLGDGLTLAMKN